MASPGVAVAVNLITKAKRSLKAASDRWNRPIPKPVNRLIGSPQAEPATPASRGWERISRNSFSQFTNKRLRFKWIAKQLEWVEDWDGSELTKRLVVSREAGRTYRRETPKTKR